MATAPIASLTKRQYMLVLFGLLLVWPAVLNRGPFLFPDTTAYLRSVDAAVVRVTGHRSAWSNADVLRVADQVSSSRRSPRQLGAGDGDAEAFADPLADALGDGDGEAALPTATLHCTKREEL